MICIEGERVAGDDRLLRASGFNRRSAWGFGGGRILRQKAAAPPARDLHERWHLMPTPIHDARAARMKMAARGWGPEPPGRDGKQQEPRYLHGCDAPRMRVEKREIRTDHVGSAVIDTRESGCVALVEITDAIL